jgi:2-iminobutanoate/2-iminopropanoate deaminase
MNPKIQEINTDKAPKAIGPYSQGIITEQFVFVSGQIPIDPSIGKIIHKKIEEQARLVLDNLQAVLLAAGLNFEHVVKTEIYLKDMNDFQIVNSIYAEKFSGAIKPARQVVEVSRLPQDAVIEISCIALRP